MYLKALEMHGFKSFPDRTRLVFDKPITAIVGPNGSGKSNIADALQWVMGEQSTRALRGGKMEDVIFGGTEKRAQLGFAEVTLVLDNSGREFDIDSDEAEITRRYYRSGESEYYINKKSVRLRDINELFMDTGLGRDGYSIIGQGKIDSILSAKSTDRREIFEEAAGISRYRYRKEESEKKLQHAEDDLTRVGDKISELEMQVEPLREQSAAAKKYLNMRDELRGLEVTIWLEELDGITARINGLEQDAIAAGGVLEKARKELEELYAASERCTEKLHEKDLEADEIRKSISESEAEVSEMESAAAVLRAGLVHNRENTERINEEIIRLEGNSSGIQAQIEEHQKRIKDILLEDGSLKKRLQEIESGSAGLDDEEEGCRRRLAELEREREKNLADESAARTELSSFAGSMQELEDRESGLLGAIQSESDRIESLKREAGELGKKLAEGQERSKELENVLNGHKMLAEVRRNKLNSQNDSMERLRSDFNAVRSRRKMLEDMEREYEGYSKAVKTVMSEAAHGSLRGIHGPAGELIKTSDRYALAVETAMGSAVQNIIVSTENDGKAAIGLLRRLDAGRVTFLPMSVIRGNRLRETGLESERGFEGVAVDLVSFDEKYRDIYTSLLGRTAVADSLDSAVEIAGKYGHRFRIVTLDGQVLNAGGSMTGGSVSKNTGIVSRASEIKKLGERETELKKEIDGDSSEIEKLKRELAAEEYSVRVSTDSLREAENSVIRLTGDINSSNLLISACEDRLRQLREERDISRGKSKGLEDQTEEARTRIREFESRNEEILAAIDSENGRLKSISQARAGTAEETADIRTRQASLAAEYTTQLSAVKELNSLKFQLGGDREKQKAAMEDMKRDSERITAEIASNERLTGEKRSGISALKLRLGGITDEKLALEEERSRNDRQAQEKNRRLLDYERECSEIENKRQAAQMEEKQIADKMWESYELTRTTAAGLKVEIEDQQSARRKAAEIRRKMAALGTPNLGAIEEYERVNKRYTYLTEQRDDIEKARKELLGIISDITGEMKEIFVTELKKIDNSFRETFTELFEGGRAQIELEDPDNVLESGIDIKIEPPGKTLKTLTLLSGGEKAFVAIALYYAILRVRPTPFVVMDEIEAALDDANVEKASRYLRRLCGKTQFLIITHRRGTMEEADVLFGVTMQEKGVSRVLTVDLDEAEKSISPE